MEKVKKRYSMVNQILIKTRKKNIRKKVGVKKRRRPVCRPVLLISESSCDEKIEGSM